MKVALVQCPAWSIETPPYAAACLSGYLRKKGHEVILKDVNIGAYHYLGEVYGYLWKPTEERRWTDAGEFKKIEFKLEKYLGNVAQDIVLSGAKIVGFSVCSTSKLSSLYLAEKIKKLDKNIFVIFGGPECSRADIARELVSGECVDAVVIGEGEQTVSELISMVKENKLEACNGSIIKGPCGILYGNERQQITDINQLPLPDYDGLPLESYTRPKWFTISSSRGCVGQCSFCYERYLWKYYRFRKAENTFKEMLHLKKKYNAEHFRFSDSLINGNMDGLSKLCDLVIENGLKVNWDGMARIDSRMTYQLLEKMKNAGCVSLNYGVESFSQKVLDTMNKGYKVKDIITVIRNTRRAGISMNINLIVGHPDETNFEFLKTLFGLVYLRLNNAQLGPISPCWVIPGAELHQNPKKFNMVIPDNNLLWYTIDNQINLEVRIKRAEMLERFAKLLGMHIYGKFRVPEGEEIEVES